MRELQADAAMRLVSVGPNRTGKPVK